MLMGHLFHDIIQNEISLMENITKCAPHDIPNQQYTSYSIQQVTGAHDATFRQVWNKLHSWCDFVKKFAETPEALCTLFP